MGFSGIRGPDEVHLSARPTTWLRVLPCIKTAVRFHFLNCWEQGSKLRASMRMGQTCGETLPKIIKMGEIYQLFFEKNKGIFLKTLSKCCLLTILHPNYFLLRSLM